MRTFFTSPLIFDSRLIKLSISAGVLLFSFLVGLVAIDLPIKWVLLSIGGLVFIGIALKNMMAALTILVATSATLDLTISSGRASPIPFSLLAAALLIGIWLLRMVIEHRQIRLLPLPINLPFLGFIPVLFLSWLAGFVVWDEWIKAPGNLVTVQSGQIAIFLLTIGTLLLVSNHPIREKYLQWWSGIIIGIGAFTIFYRTFINPNFEQNLVTFAVINWPFILLWGQLLFNRRLKPWMWIGGIAVSGVWVYYIISATASWKGGWVPAALAFIFMVWFKNKKVFIFLVIVSSLLLIFNWNRFNQGVLQGEIASGSSIRPVLWYDIIRLSSRSPIIGLGPVNYKFYWQDPSFTPLSRIANGWEAWDEFGYSPPSHNMFVDIFAQTGLVGLGLIVWGLIASLKLCYRAAARAPSDFNKGYVYAVFCGFASLCIASFLFADMLIPFVYNLTITQFRTSIYSWILLGSVIAFDQSGKGGLKN